MEVQVRRFIQGKKFHVYRLCSALLGVATAVVASGAGHKFS
jgi:hypothetical protein